MDGTLLAPWTRMVAAKERFLARSAAIAPAIRDAPHPMGGWGPIGILEHLVLAESGMTNALAKEPNPERPRRLGGGGRWPFWVVRVVLRTGIRIKAPTDTILPQGGVGWELLLQRWGEQRERLEEWLEGVPREVMIAPRFKHPIAGWLDVRDALVFAGEHIQHHVRQLQRVAAVFGRGQG